jgi:hypothetical protein
VPIPEPAWQDAPFWLVELVRGTWEVPEWRAWDAVWEPELAKRGVTPALLEPIGDPARPEGISARPPGGRWCSGEIRWEADDERTAVLEGIRRLVDDLTAAVGAH